MVSFLGSLSIYLEKVLTRSSPQLVYGSLEKLLENGEVTDWREGDETYQSGISCYDCGAETRKVAYGFFIASCVSFLLSRFTTEAQTTNQNFPGGPTYLNVSKNFLGQKQLFVDSDHMQVEGNLSHFFPKYVFLNIPYAQGSIVYEKY